MKLAADPAVAAWLLGQPAFEWDTGNSTKSMVKHGNSTAEVESLLEHPVVLAGRIVEPAHAEPRWLLLGQSTGGKLLALVFTRRGDRLRPISCRAMRRTERSQYAQAVVH